MTIALGAEKPIFPHIVFFSQARGVCVRKIFPVRYLKWVNVGREHIEVVKGHLQRFFVLDFNDQVMNKFVEHQMLSIFKEFWGDCHKHFKKYSDPKEAHANPRNSNHGRTRFLDRSSVTIITVGQSRFYNDSTSRLRKNRSWSIVWSSFEKHTFESERSCGRPQRMSIIKCGNSSPSLPQRVVNHSLGMRYAIRCWVDDQATQNAFIGDTSRRPARRRVRAVTQRHVLSRPQKERFKYKLNLIKLWIELNCKIEIFKR
uniref:CACTA en-spm transposon protein n=1 Tax=Cucumis melo TaxID=3656 RepID=A0A9I9EFX1_CUCME